MEKIKPSDKLVHKIAIRAGLKHINGDEYVLWLNNRLSKQLKKRKFCLNLSRIVNVAFKTKDMVKSIEFITMLGFNMPIKSNLSLEQLKKSENYISPEACIYIQIELLVIDQYIDGLHKQNSLKPEMYLVCKIGFQTCTDLFKIAFSGRYYAKIKSETESVLKEMRENKK